MDKDDFDQWRDSTVTQWFMAKLTERAKETATAIQDQLYELASYRPSDWAEKQPQAAYVKGHSEALVRVTAYTFEDLEPQEDSKE